MTSPDATLPRAVDHVISERVIRRYAELSGDHNPLHVDPAYAARTSFGGPIAHGPLALQPLFEAVCAWLGLEALPPGTRVLAEFRGPVPSGSTVRCEFVGREEVDGSVVLRAVCRLSSGPTAVEVEVAFPAGGGA
jgi:3-hydroxybutyryl-CoA dehydratase